MKKTPSPSYRKNTLRTISIIIVILIAVASAGIDTFLLGSTVVSAPLCITGCIAFAICTAPLARPLWTRITGCGSRITSYICHILTAAPIALCLFLSLNYFPAQSSDMHTIRTPIKRLYTETHYRTRRVARRVVGRGTPYEVYFAEVTMPTGKLKSISISARQYRQLHSADSLSLNIRTGLLGLPVIDPHSLSISVPPRVTSAKRISHPIAR
ncbi:MAG: hypothetical protein NC043_06750 [Muribaculaceae bacterium]|nr:hypothetical protein [Muribaculaceae bacterium]